MNYQELVTTFAELMRKGEKDQWKLAELAYLASERYGGVKQFAEDTGYAYSTINRYKGAYAYLQGNELALREGKLTFADVIVLADMSEDRAAAVQVLAGAMGRAIGTVKNDTEAINIVQDFLKQNPELVKEALKDDDARSAVAAAAYRAAAEGVVAGAEGITREAAGKKVGEPKQETRGMKAVEIQRLKHEVARAARENGLLTSRWERDLAALIEAMSPDELTFIYDELAKIIDRTSTLRGIVDEARRTRV